MVKFVTIIDSPLVRDYYRLTAGLLSRQTNVRLFLKVANFLYSTDSIEI